MSLPDTIFIFALALVIFGPKKLPEIGRQIGKLVYEFRRASNEFKLQIEEELRSAEEADRQKQFTAEASSLPAASVVASEISSEPSDTLTVHPPSTGAQVSADSPSHRYSTEEGAEDWSDWSGDAATATGEAKDIGESGSEQNPEQSFEESRTPSQNSTLDAGMESNPDPAQEQSLEPGQEPTLEEIFERDEEPAPEEFSAQSLALIHEEPHSQALARTIEHPLGQAEEQATNHHG